MEASFWHEKWQINQIGFHLNKPNPLLLTHFDKLQLSKKSRIFLPLCGKTLDIAYLLEQGFQLIGSELSEIAIEALFADLNIKPNTTNIGSLKLYQAENIHIYVGDFFDLTDEILGHIDAVYDRAALIALPLETRSLYSKHLVEITKNAPQLIITLDYDQTISKGPPFSVTPAELKQHYEVHYDIDCLVSNFSEDGLKGKHPVTESVWKLLPLV